MYIFWGQILNLGQYIYICINQISKNVFFGGGGGVGGWERIAPNAKALLHP